MLPEPRPGVVVADAVPLMRSGVAAALAAEGFSMLAATAQARDLPTLVHTHRPDVVVIGLPEDVSAAAGVRLLRATPDGPRIVVLVGRASPEVLAELLSTEVDALVPRSIDGDRLVEIVRRVAAGHRVVDPAVLADDGPADADAEPAALTARESEVLGLLRAGHSNREIASSLYVSLPTVKTHLAHIYAKLGAKNRNEALGRAVARGLLV